jgi:hypothetical protein
MNFITNLHVSSGGVRPKGNYLFRRICTAEMLNSKTGMAYRRLALDLLVELTVSGQFKPIDLFELALKTGRL